MVLVIARGAFYVGSFIGVTVDGSLSELRCGCFSEVRNTLVL